MVNPLRHREKIAHLESPFGSDTFGQLCEKFARAFGTPQFIVIQTFVVAAWIVLNVTALVHHWDPFPYILLNLCFSTQAAYAAPMILLAQTRQADRDKASGKAEAEHREEIAAGQTELLKKNTVITQNTEKIARILHDHIVGETQDKSADG